MPDDYLPSADPAFDAWLAQFATYLTANATPMGLTSDDTTDTTAWRTTWTDNYTGYRTAREAAAAAQVRKERVREQVEEYLRPLVRRLQTLSSVGDDHRRGLGITVADTTRTRTPVPTSRPVLLIGKDKALEHRINFADEGTPTKKAKPEGVAAVEIWASLPSESPAPPTEAGEYRLLGTDSVTPYLAVYEIADAGKRVWYRARWINTRQERGPWSEPVAAVVTG